MTTDTATGETTTTAHGATGPLWFRPAGRHRKPRPRRVALAVGGFALAAGALSLVRLAPETVTGGGGTAEAAPRIDATDTAATVGTAGAVPSGSADRPSTTAVIRAAGASPAATPATRPSGAPSSPASRALDPSTGIPEAPSTPTASGTHGSPAAPAPTAPRPAPSTTAPTQTPAPAPNPPGLCVPTVGLCVNGLPVLGG
ncbi:hypothetical protein ABZ876_02330 [Streptomyces sp. NPDC046931]|uniref:hypothetical protein n=1 Tax=Streptomyces sp. NPDC046931 TaxID=3154806 RepID=UPI0033CDB3F7